MDEAAQVIARLTAVGRTLVTAESCTGGLLGKLLNEECTAYLSHITITDIETQLFTQK